MINLRLTIISLLICLTLFFNIERLDLGQENAVNISSFVYVLGFVYIICIISLPKLFLASQYITTLMCIAGYFFCKLLVFNSNPLFGSIYTYVSITEITLLTILVWLTSRISFELQAFQKAIDHITLSKMGKRVRSLEESLHLVDNEMIRSRRHQHSLSVIVVEPEDSSVNVNLKYLMKNLQKTIMSRFVFTHLANILGKEIRRPDLVIEQNSKKRFIILCPETTGSNSIVLTDRIQRATAQTDLPIVYGVATFPDEALTFNELVKKAESRLKRPEEPSDVLVTEGAQEEINE